MFCFLLPGVAYLCIAFVVLILWILSYVLRLAVLSRVPMYLYYCCFVFTVRLVLSSIYSVMLLFLPSVLTVLCCSVADYVGSIIL